MYLIYDHCPLQDKLFLPATQKAKGIVTAIPLL